MVKGVVGEKNVVSLIKRAVWPAEGGCTSCFKRAVWPARPRPAPPRRLHQLLPPYSSTPHLLLACERLEAEKAALARERDEALAARDRAIAAYKGRALFSRLGVADKDPAADPAH